MSSAAGGSPAPSAVGGGSRATAVALTALALLAAFVLGTALLQPPRGDEPGVYLPVIRASAGVWPQLNLVEVAYGLSPLWTWLTGGLSALGAGDLLGGRLLSFGAWCACLLLCRRGDSGLNLPLAALLVHPVLVVYAARAHPLWPAMLLMLLAARAGAGLRGRLALAAAAATLQSFLLPALALLGVLADRGFPARVRGFLMLSVAALAGIVVNWLLYGGQYPAAFKASHYYDPYRDFSGLTLAYLPLLLGFGGWLAAALVRGAPGRVALVTALVGALVCGLVLPGARPNGPLFNLSSAIGPGAMGLAAAAIGLGWGGWLRGGRLLWQPLLGALVGAASLATLPFFYERYAWFVVVPVFAVCAAATPAAEWGRRWPAAWTVVASGAGGLLLWKGGL